MGDSVLKALLVLLALSSLAFAAPDQLQQSILSGNRDWVVGMKTGDAARIAATYTDDAVFCGPKGDCIKGRVAVQELYKSRLAKTGNAADAWAKSTKVERDGEYAYEWGWAETTFADGQSSKGRYLTVWKAQPDGTWKIVRNIVLP